MADRRESVMLSEGELHRAGQLVDSILDVVASDAKWLKAFAASAGFDPQTGRPAAKSPGFMLSVLDAAAKDAQLLAALERNGPINRALIELTEARLCFHMAALTRHGRGDEPGTDAGNGLGRSCSPDREKEKPLTVGREGL